MNTPGFTASASIEASSRNFRLKSEFVKHGEVEPQLCYRSPSGAYTCVDCFELPTGREICYIYRVGISPGGVNQI